MPILGKETIKVGLQNQSANSDTLWTAFTKINNNFTTLFNTASPSYTFTNGNGINSNLSGQVLTITNTGVVSLVEGSGISLDNSNGVVTISVSGDAEGNIVAGVTRVGLNSQTLNVFDSPIVSSGNITINLPESGVTADTYIAPTIVVDKYGRILSAQSTPDVGTVTSVQVVGGSGISVEGSPITTNGNITITNTGVTRLKQGTGIVLSGGNGEVTISMAVPTIGLYSNSMVIESSFGANSITSEINFPVFGASSNIVANGTTLANAVGLTKHLNIVSSSTATNNGVRLPELPSEGIGYSVKIVNTSANVLNIYPPANNFINELTMNTSITIAGNARMEFSYAGGNRWYTF